jgi:hypothetical protein
MCPPFENSLFIVYDDSRDPGVKFDSQLAKCWVHWLGPWRGRYASSAWRSLGEIVKIVGMTSGEIAKGYVPKARPEYRAAKGQRRKTAV